MGGLCHGAELPRGAPPPPRSATPTRSSTSAILLSRTHPLRPHDPHDAAPESAPAASSPTRVRARNGRTPGWPCGAPHADGRPRSSRNAPPPKRICRRRPSSPHSPCTVQIVRPLAAASQEAAGRAMRSTAPWTTAGAFVRRARHEGPGVQTRAFTYSDLLILPRRRPRPRRRRRTSSPTGPRQNPAEGDWQRQGPDSPAPDAASRAPSRPPAWSCTG